MKRNLFTIVLFFFCSIGFYLLPAGAYALPVDLNDFFLEGDGNISPDGSSATLEVQDPDYGYSMLVNDPLWSDPGIKVDACAYSLSFGFDFFEANGNDTELYVRLLDGLSGDLIADFGVVDTSTGTHVFDLSSLLSGQTLLGLDFTITEREYNPNNGYNVGSRVTISDLDLAVKNPAPVPEPGTILLLGTGLVALGGGLRRKHH